MRDFYLCTLTNGPLRLSPTVHTQFITLKMYVLSQQKRIPCMCSFGNKVLLCTRDMLLILRSLSFTFNSITLSVCVCFVFFFTYAIPFIANVHRPQCTHITYVQSKVRMKTITQCTRCSGNASKARGGSVAGNEVMKKVEEMGG